MTGVQTCALPIFFSRDPLPLEVLLHYIVLHCSILSSTCLPSSLVLEFPLLFLQLFDFLEVKFELVYGKIILCQKHIVREIPYHIISFLESNRQTHHCSLSFLHKLFSIHYLKNCSLFSHKTPSEIMFSKFKRKSECFFMFKFHNNRIFFLH